MNRQIGYITSAHLILLGIGLVVFFLSKIPFDSSNDNPATITAQVNEKKVTKLSQQALDGKILFIGKCAVCHKLSGTGLHLADVIDNECWADRKRLYRWLKNPEAFMKTDGYTRSLKKEYGAIMPAFPDLTDEEIEGILSYISSATN